MSADPRDDRALLDRAVLAQLHDVAWQLFQLLGLLRRFTDTLQLSHRTLIAVLKQQTPLQPAGPCIYCQADPRDLFPHAAFCPFADTETADENKA